MLIDSRILQKKQVFEATENKSRWLFLKNKVYNEKNSRYDLNNVQLFLTLSDISR